AAAKEVPLTGATLLQAQAARLRILSARERASRYLDQIGDIEKVTRWIEKSAQREQDEIERLKRGRRVLLAGLAAAFAMLAIVVWFWWQTHQSKTVANEQLARN